MVASLRKLSELNWPEPDCSMVRCRQKYLGRPRKPTRFFYRLNHAHFIHRSSATENVSPITKLWTLNM